MADVPYPRVSVAATDGRPTVVTIGGHAIGGGHFGVIAGAPTALSASEALAVARDLAAAGATLLHDGTTSQTDPHPRSTADRAALARAMREETGLPVAVGLVDAFELEALAEVADAIQVAAFHMQDYTLLSALGEIDKPVLLRRGSASLLEELLMAAEYILAGGNGQVLLCERGIRTFERAYEVTVDFAAIPVLRERTHLPILVDPSEYADPRIVRTLAVAAAAAGADGVVLEAEDADPAMIERLRRASKLAGAR